MEPGPLLGAGVLGGEDHLEGDDAFEAQVPGLVDNAHAAAAQLARNLVTGHRLAGRAESTAIGGRGAGGRIRGQRRHGQHWGRTAGLAMSEADTVASALPLLAAGAAE